MDTVQITPEWKILVQEYCFIEYGALVTHPEIEQLTGLSRKREPMRYYRNCARWCKTMLDDYGKAMETVQNVGYRVVIPKDYRKHTRRQMKFSAKHSKYARKIADNAPLNLMENEERNAMTEMHIHAATLDHFMSKLMLKSRLIKPPKINTQIEMGTPLDVADKSN